MGKLSEITKLSIEELCDEFVVIDEKGEYYITHRFDRHLIIWSNKNEHLYGAIWTDEGLVYVAKMNDKGELELI